MPTLDNARHELFAQGVAKGKTQGQAYIDAGYSEDGADQNASRLISNDKVATRIAELQEKAANRAVLTITKATEDLLRIAKKGEDLSDAPGLNVAKGAIMDACKLNGLVIDKTLGAHTSIDELLSAIADED